MFHPKDCKEIAKAAELSGNAVMRIKTVKEMKVFDLMTGGDESGEYINQMNSSTDEIDFPTNKRLTRQEKNDAVKNKLEEYADSYLDYEDISRPEIEVLVYFGKGGSAEENGIPAKMKIKRVIRL